MKNQNLEKIEQEEASLWADILDMKPSGGSYKTLPDGKYTGRVYINPKTVNNDGPNYGRKKYEFELVVIDGDFKGKTAYHHRVLMPASLGVRPDAEDKAALQTYLTQARQYAKKTRELLDICGVDTNEKDREQLAKNIAKANSLRPVVNFTMSNGTPYLNYLISQEKPEAGDNLFTNTLPDGNDAPIA